MMMENIFTKIKNLFTPKIIRVYENLISFCINLESGFMISSLCSS